MKVAYIISDGRSFRLLVARRGEGGFMGVLEHGNEVEVKEGDLGSIIAMVDPFIGSSGRVSIDGAAKVKFYRTNNGWLMITQGNVKSIGALTSKEILSVIDTLTSK